MQPCKFALKVWNAQQAGAIGVSQTCPAAEIHFADHVQRNPGSCWPLSWIITMQRAACAKTELPMHCMVAMGKQGRALRCVLCCAWQVIVVNYEDRSTTMEAPDDEDRSLKCAARPTYCLVPHPVASSSGQLCSQLPDTPVLCDPRSPPRVAKWVCLRPTRRCAHLRARLAGTSLTSQSQQLS